ncbi:Putative acetyltransferase [Roseimaritima multifibrata]|uniref:Acetyltransferase n=1 Tax=Roseimaritima multifibrata TaxID=1930274 RepID=A0A517MN90_9BACT|nr:acyltransferase [Roseimaritima multifibrata]QDS96358.1 Putative acetyltransferase [Roseimaritima multifibrata]
MDSKNVVRRESGVRKYQSRSFLQRYHQWRLLRRLGAFGAGVFVEQDVSVWRHPERVRLGNNVILKEGVRICPAHENAEIEIGDWTTVGYQTYLFATSQISIGKNCLIAPFCYFVDANHGIRRGQIIREQPMSAAPIAVADDVWIGVGAVVLKGVSIGEGAVVSAGAVVSSDVPDYAIVSGSPAKVVGERMEGRS